MQALGCIRSWPLDGHRRKPNRRDRTASVHCDISAPLHQLHSVAAVASIKKADALGQTATSHAAFFGRTRLAVVSLYFYDLRENEATG